MNDIATTARVRFANAQQLEDFANAIRDAVVSALGEHFTKIRLRDVDFNYNDLGHGRYLGVTRGTHHVSIEVTTTHSDSILTFAATILHELAHATVGVKQQHNENWQEACNALGLLDVSPTHSRDAIQTDFTPRVYKIIEDAARQFLHDHPLMMVDSMEIPWPPTIGTHECPNPHESFHACTTHTAHILKFQIEDIRDMLTHTAAQKHTLLANEMGLGKTVEVMGYINATQPKRIFIACPNNAKLIWERHFQQFSAHPYDVEVAHTALYMFGDVVIMNYEAVVKWGDAIRRQEWDLVVYDEGHYLKSPSAKRSKACYAIHGTKQIIITGTPIVNYPYEVFPLIHYLDRQNWPEYGRFEAEHGSRSSEKLGRNLNRLNAKLRATIMVRRLKKDVLPELPRKRRQIIEFEVPDAVRPLIESEKKIFNSLQGAADAEMVRFLNAMKNESEVSIDDVDWAALVESLQATRRFAFEEMARIAHNIALAKLPLVYEHLEQILENREKVVVFGHHRDVLSSIADKFKPNAVLLLGGTADQGAATQLASDRFNNDDNCRLFVSGVKLAAGYSLRGSSTIVFVEEDWVPGIMTQAEDRAHGIGRGDADARSMLIQHLVFEDSLDTFKAQLTIKKQKSIDRALGSNRG